MRLTSIILIAFLSLLTFQSIAQNYTVPKGYTLEEKEDYVDYEEEVLEGITWLENTPVNQNEQKRQEASKFLLQWMMGAPNVSIGIDETVTGLSNKNPNLLLSFMGGWTKFALENPEEKDNAARGYLAGIQSVIKVYQLNVGKGMKKDKKVEELIKLQKKGELKAWAAKQAEAFK